MWREEFDCDFEMSARVALLWAAALLLINIGIGVAIGAAIFG